MSKVVLVVFVQFGPPRLWRWRHFNYDSSAAASSRADSHHHGVTEFPFPGSKRHPNVVNHKCNILHCLGCSCRKRLVRKPIIGWFPVCHTGITGNH